LLDAKRRIQRAWSADGLSELAAGLLFLLPALLEWAKTNHPPSSPRWQTLNTIQMLVIFPGVWIAMWSLPRIRNRLFADRAGIMIPRIAPEGSSKALGILALAAMTALVAALALKKTTFTVATIILGFGVGALFFRTGLSAGIRRYPVMGILVAAASILIAFQATTFETAFTWQMGFVGALCTITGAVTLLRFLRQRA
ncbi:MAG: hypothetical protein JNL62_20930, partial [Bryobacterales bacterium]|nr:hypothetical protein [Bryobacterales bacterium]